MAHLNRKVLVIGVFGLVGLAGGLYTTPRHAHACDCPPDYWEYQLATVEGPEGAPDHEAYWPIKVILNASPDDAVLGSTEMESGAVVDLITAEEPLEEGP